MKAALLAVGLLLAASIAHAQVTITAPGVTIGRTEDGDYWRRQREGQKEAEWRAREEYKEEAAKSADWQHSHCVRDWEGKEFCRR